MTKGKNTYKRTYIATGQNLYILHIFFVQGDNKSKGLSFILQSNLGQEYETNMFSL